MWSPTHVQVVVQKARNLPIKGKNGTNDAFVTIQLGKEKFQTSTKEKAENPEWNEECELTIPDGNKSCIILSVLHRNFVGLDKFLGQVQILLNELDVYERAKSRWYQLENKPGKPSTKKRGDLEVRLSFTVKSVTGSLMDLSKKPKKTNSLPLKMVHNVGGSLMNLASKDKKHPHLPFKSIASYGHKLSEKFPLKKSSKSEKAEGKIAEHETEPEHDDDQSSHLSAFDSDEEQFTFGFEQLSDDFVIPASDYAPDSPLARQQSVNHPTEDTVTPLHDSVAIPSSEQTKPSVFQERDEWQSKLLGNQMPESRERRRSVPSLPLVQESPLEGSGLVKEDVPPPVPAKPRERPHKLRLEKNNVRRHTVEGIKLVLPDAPKTAPPKPPPPKFKPEGTPQATENDTKNSNSNTTTPSSGGPVTSSTAVMSARQNAPAAAPRTQSMSVSKTLTPSTAPVATSAPTATTVTATSNNNNTMSSNDVRSPTTNTKPKSNTEKLQVASSKLLSNLPREKVDMFEKMSKEDLVELIVCQQSSIDKHLRQIHDLEDYIDGLLVRVMETTPRLLQNPYKLSSSIRLTVEGLGQVACSNVWKEVQLDKGVWLQALLRQLLSSAQERAWR